MCKQLAGIGGDSYSGYGYPILLSLQMKSQAQYNEDCVGSFPSLKQGGTCELNIFVNGQALPFCVKPIYLGIKLDRVLTFCRHLESLRKTLTSHVELLRRLAGSSWGADATVLRKATIALVHFTAEYCVPVWCRSSHTRFIDKSINNALSIVTECLHSTPTDNLFILSGIQSTKLCAKKLYCIEIVAHRSQNISYMKGSYLHFLRSFGNLNQDTFVPAVLELLNDPSQLGTRVARWTKYRWSMEWQKNTSRLHTFIGVVGPPLLGISFPRPAWVKLNCHQIGVDLFHSETHK